MPNLYRYRSKVREQCHAQLPNGQPPGRGPHHRSHGKWADACPVDEATLTQLMGEIASPALRKLLLRFCIEIAESDAHVAQGEAVVRNAAVEHWGLQRFILETPWQPQ